MSVHTALVKSWSEGPTYTTTDPPPPPSPSEIQINVKATGLHQLVKSRAVGKHYTSGPLPHIPGVDGVGIDSSTGKIVYFSTLGAGVGVGSFCEVVNVGKEDVWNVPGYLHEGDKSKLATVAGFMNPIMSSWMAFMTRVDGLRAGEFLAMKALKKDEWTCLIIGATSASGKIAIRVARKMGAGKVIGVARSEGKLKDMKELDGYVVMNEDVEVAEFQKFGAVDVVLDYIYGPVVGKVLQSAMPGVKMQYVQIGSLGGLETALPAAALRSRDVTIRGSGPGAWSMDQYRREIPAMLELAVGLDSDGIQVFPLKDVEKGWQAKEDRVVFVL